MILACPKCTVILKVIPNVKQDVETKLLFVFKSDIDGSVAYQEVSYTESLNRELRVLLQSENASYPPAGEAFAKTIQNIIGDAIEE
jgi:hypothetical protein